VWSAQRIPTAVNLGFLDRSRYFLETAPQLSSRGSVDPAPDPLHLRKSGSAENQTRTSGSVGRNSDHLTTETVTIKPCNWKIFRFLRGLHPKAELANQKRKKRTLQGGDLYTVRPEPTSERELTKRRQDRTGTFI
jgi:hypothetical protein